MLDPEAVRRSAERHYRGYLSALALGTDPFPLDVRFAKVKPGEAATRYRDLRRELTELRAHSDESGRRSYRVEWEERSDRLAGTQRFPRRIFFPDADSLLEFIGKSEEAGRFLADIRWILAAFPSLRSWIARHPEKVVASSGSWETLVKVLRWFTEHPRPRLFMREIPVVEDTKFIERHRSILRELLDLVLPADAVNREASSFEERYGLRQPEAQIRVRLLDPAISKRHLAGITELAISTTEIARLDFPEITTVIIVENKASFANLDVLLSLPEIPGTMAVFGSGFASLALRDCRWMEQRTLLYWGDIDTQGLRILAGLRRFFRNLESILMDEETFDRFPAARSTAPPDALGAPAGLTAAETHLYLRLGPLAAGNRLEQERIPAWWASARISDILQGARGG